MAWLRRSDRTRPLDRIARDNARIDGVRQIGDDPWVAARLEACAQQLRRRYHADEQLRTARAGLDDAGLAVEVAVRDRDAEGPPTVFGDDEIGRVAAARWADMERGRRRELQEQVDGAAAKCARLTDALERTEVETIAALREIAASAQRALVEYLGHLNRARSGLGRVALPPIDEDLIDELVRQAVTQDDRLIDILQEAR